MIKELCLIFLFALIFSATAVAEGPQVESVNNSPPAASKTETGQKGEVQSDKKSPPAPNPVSEEEDEPSIYDDEHG
ncbi:hypothetical protein SAMN05660420_03135 [Desulfuromusa kysingii]|uniref:Secreted protein n=1 Tax=Desulfuromusa kysingii TaxID=37625 RepID=A0A1H4DX70_9BACT|nr:hypothetical protein [Desulfuromusa kysingii]SEA77395.1 hypothetical protein SAMN05660420_03135 [Desulfuromusa kysingii]